MTYKGKKRKTGRLRFLLGLVVMLAIVSVTTLVIAEGSLYGPPMLAGDTLKALPEPPKPPKQQKVYANGTARKITVEASAYTPWDEGNSMTGLCADGSVATPGYSIAVDPKVIPMGSRIFVPGWGWGKASDTGGYIKGYRIDLCMATVKETDRWGRRDIEIEVYTD